MRKREKGFKLYVSSYIYNYKGKLSNSSLALPTYVLPLNLDFASVGLGIRYGGLSGP